MEKKEKDEGYDYFKSIPKEGIYTSPDRHHVADEVVKMGLKPAIAVAIIFAIVFIGGLIAIALCFGFSK